MKVSRRRFLHVGGMAAVAGRLAGAAAPRPGMPDPKQAAVVAAFARYAVQHKAVYDEAGNVVKLAISNHTAFWRGKQGPPPEPMPESLFREGILKLPHLEAIALEKQNLGDASYAMLGRLTKLRDVRLHYMQAGCGATPDAPRFINDLPLPLEVLEIKHNFSIKGGCTKRVPTSRSKLAETRWVVSKAGLPNRKMPRGIPMPRLPTSRRSRRWRKFTTARPGSRMPRALST